MDNTLNSLIAWKKSLFLIMISQALAIVFMVLFFGSEFSTIEVFSPGLFDFARLPDLLWFLENNANNLIPIATKEVSTWIIVSLNYVVSVYALLVSLISYLKLAKRSPNKLIISLELLVLFTFILVFILPFKGLYIALLSILFLINLIIIVVYSIYDVKYRNEKK